MNSLPARSLHGLSAQQHAALYGEARQSAHALREQAKQRLAKNLLHITLALAAALAAGIALTLGAQWLRARTPQAQQRTPGLPPPLLAPLHEGKALSA